MLLLHYIAIPPAALEHHTITILKLPPHRANYNMVDQVAPDDNANITTSEGGREINTAADLARLQNEGKILTPQELKELSARIKALEEMAKMEDRLRTLKSRKHPRSQESSEQTFLPEDLTASNRPAEAPLPSRGPFIHRQTQGHPQTETDDLDSNSSSSTTVTQHRPYKRRRYTKGIKVTPSYTLRVSSSLREWGDWKKEMERVFKGDPYSYPTGAQKILKALDYVDSSLKSLWYTHDEQQGGITKWPTFIHWTRDNIQNGQNAVATLYEQFNAAKQLPEKSPIQFNAYLSAIERDLPQQEEKASAMTFYSKLTKELKKQFRTADIPIPETRARCVAVAQRVWEGLHGFEDKKDFQRDSHSHKNSKEKDYKDSRKKDDSRSRYPQTDSRRDRKDRYRLGHRHKDDQNKEKWRSTTEKEVICFKCNKPGHYAPDCPDQKESTKRAKIQSTREDHSQSRTSSRSSSPSSSRSSSKAPETPTSDSDSSDSLN